MEEGCIMIKYLPLILLAGCLHNVTPEDTSECWRYGVAMDNTGPMSSKPLYSIPVVKMDYDELLVACDVPPEQLSWHNKNELQIRACYSKVDDTIYSYKLNLGSNDYFSTHERCHIMLGERHNSCNGTGYAQWGKDIQSACNWNL